jgi:25S rRNA (cytosine2278-C5)-methyltransferase
MRMPGTGKSSYAEAAWVLDGLAARQGSLRALLHAPEVTQTRQVYALVCQTLKYRAALTEAVDAAGVLQAEPRLAARPHAALVIAYDLLIGSGVHGRGSWQQDMKRHAPRLADAWAALLHRRGARVADDLLPDHVRHPPWIPRWVRVNRLRRSAAAVLARLRDRGYTVLPPTVALDDLQAAAAGVGHGRWVWQDPSLPEVLALPPTAALWDDHGDWVRDGTLVVQDRASCLPAYALGVDRATAHVIDACAAPGNKTSALAACMRNAGRVTACDSDGARLDLLRRLCARAGASNVVPWHGSFLTLDPHAPAFADVTHVLVDPSCSGSGIVRRRLEDDGDMDAGTMADTVAVAETVGEGEGEGDEEADVSQDAPGKERLRALAAFQTAAVLHALQFPAVQRVCYSTCSVHRTENEAVVARVLAEAPDFDLVTAAPTWPRYARRPGPGGLG